MPRPRGEVKGKGKGREKAKGPFVCILQSGPARSQRAHALSDEHLDRGMEYAIKALWDDAIIEFEKAVHITPEFSEGWNNLGVAYYYQQRYEDAQGALEEALKHLAGWSVALANLGQVLLKSGNAKAAAQYFHQALNKNPKQVQVWAAYGEALEEQGLLDEAAHSFQEALKLDPEYDWGLLRQGLCLAQKGDFDQAVEHLNGALQRNPDFLDAAATLGIIYARAGRLDFAKQHFQMAQGAADESTRAEGARGLAMLEYYETGLQKGILELGATYPQMPSIRDCFFALGVAQAKARRFEDALTSFQAAQQEDTGWVVPRVWVGFLNALVGNPMAAMEQLSQVQEVMPQDGFLQETLGLLCLLMDYHAEAKEHLEAARQIGRQIPDLSAAFPPEAPEAPPDTAQ